MIEKTYTSIGVMSGTSLDGLDLAKVVFTKNTVTNTWSFQLIQALTVPFPKQLFTQLKTCMQLSAYDLLLLDRALGKFIGQEVKKLNLSDVQLIASHGHTVFHTPEKGITHQIGSVHEIHAQCNLPVVGDFRSLDVALQGQGAPLVPIGDKLLFSTYYDALINLGGIANVSFTKNEAVSAFDICPFNQVSNYLCEKHLDSPFDNKGIFGSTGIVKEELLHAFQEFSYYKTSGPKSLGKEHIDEYFIPLLEEEKYAPKDMLRTFYEHTSTEIAKVLNDKNAENVLLSGGGVYNVFVRNLIQKKAKTNTRLFTPTAEIINFKEAIVFAFLGVLKALGEVNVLNSVTGSTKNHSGGVLVGKVPF